MAERTPLPRASSTVAHFPLEVCRNRTANGGYEWWLQVANQRVQDLGIFTEPDATIAEVVPRLFRQTMKQFLHE